MGTGAERGARDFLAKLRTSALPHASCRGCRGRGGRGAGGEGRRRPASEACPGGPSHRTRPSGGEVRSEPRGGHGASTVGAKWASAAQNDLPSSPQDTSHGTRPPGASRRRWGGQGDRAGPPRAQAPSGSPGAGAAGGALPDRGLGTRAAAAGCRRKPPAAFRQFEEAQTGTQTGDFTRLIVGVYPATRTGNPGPRAGSEAGGAARHGRTAAAVCPDTGKRRSSTSQNRVPGLCTSTHVPVQRLPVGSGHARRQAWLAAATHAAVTPARAATPCLVTLPAAPGAGPLPDPLCQKGAESQAWQGGPCTQVTQLVSGTLEPGL